MLFSEKSSTELRVVLHYLSNLQRGIVTPPPEACQGLLLSIEPALEGADLSRPGPQSPQAVQALLFGLAANLRFSENPALVWELVDYIVNFDKENTALLQLLIQNGLSVNAEKAPLHPASASLPPEAGFLEMAENAAVLRLRAPKSEKSAVAFEGSSLLMQVLNAECPALLEVLLGYPALTLDINFSIDKAQPGSPLFFAVTKNNPALMRPLAKAATIITDPAGMCAAFKWTFQHEDAALRQIILHKAKVAPAFQSEDFMPIHQSLQAQDGTALAQLLAIETLDIEEWDASLHTPLTLACNSGYLEGVSLLVRRGANIYAVNGLQQTPIRIALKKIAPELLLALIENITHFDDSTIYSQCLDMAIYSGHDPLLRALLRKSPPPSAEAEMVVLTRDAAKKRVLTDTLQGMAVAEDAAAVLCLLQMAKGNQDVPLMQLVLAHPQVASLFRKIAEGTLPSPQPLRRDIEAQLWALLLDMLLCPEDSIDTVESLARLFSRQNWENKSYTIQSIMPGHIAQDKDGHLLYKLSALSEDYQVFRYGSMRAALTEALVQHIIREYFYHDKLDHLSLAIQAMQNLLQDADYSAVSILAPIFPEYDFSFRLREGVCAIFYAAVHRELKTSAPLLEISPQHVRSARPLEDVLTHLAKGWVGDCYATSQVNMDDLRIQRLQRLAAQVFEKAVVAEWSNTARKRGFKLVAQGKELLIYSRSLKNEIWCPIALLEIGPGRCVCDPIFAVMVAPQKSVLARVPGPKKPLSGVPDCDPPSYQDPPAPSYLPAKAALTPPRLEQVPSPGCGRKAGYEPPGPSGLRTSFTVK